VNKRTISKTNDEPKPSVAYPGKYEVLLAGGAACPHCQQPLHASDVAIDFGDVSEIT
jgi:hypothetical protein